MKLLVVEDDHSLLEVICTVLKEEAYQVDSADNGAEGLLLAQSKVYDALILDIMLPEMDGLKLVKALRSQSISTPVLFLTAKDSVEDRVRGLDVGADDYLVKPFAITELLARVRALLRRGHGGSVENIAYLGLSINPSIYDGFVDTHPLNLSQKEYELLEFLIRNSEQILFRDQIFNRVWGFTSESGINVVDVYVHYLRKKLEPYGYADVIKTVRGVGYMLKGE